MTKKDQEFMQRAIELSKQAIHENRGGPFGAVVVKDGEIIAEGMNSVTSENDPTAHAEVVAIRKAGQKLNSFQLDGCVIYTSCEPCPMCFGAIYWARPQKVYYACSRHDAADINFDDQFIYDEIGKDASERKIEFNQFMEAEALAVFKTWAEKNDKVNY